MTGEGGDDCDTSSTKLYVKDDNSLLVVASVRRIEPKGKDLDQTVTGIEVYKTIKIEDKLTNKIAITAIVLLCPHNIERDEGEDWKKS